MNRVNGTGRDKTGAEDRIESSVRRARGKVDRVIALGSLSDQATVSG